MNALNLFVASDWACMYFSKPKIKIYKHFLESVFPYSLECCSEHFLSVSDRNDKEEEQYLHGSSLWLSKGGRGRLGKQQDIYMEQLSDPCAKAVP